MSQNPNLQAGFKDPDDRCPKWAGEMIGRIRELEVSLGNINPSGDWQVSNVQDLYRRSGDRDLDEMEADEAAVEALFERIARGLTTEGFRPDEIATFINARIPSGGRLPYCNVTEVTAAL